ncbi:hypothetical protein OEG86_00690 [Hoeflea alexandrii]|nr:hypothetical protein [Hoeflea alexandrii]
MSITEKRKQVIAFSDPYALTSNYFVVRKSLDLPALDDRTRIDLSSETEEGRAGARNPAGEPEGNQNRRPGLDQRRSLCPGALER